MHFKKGSQRAPHLILMAGTKLFQVSITLGVLGEPLANMHYRIKIIWLWGALTTLRHLFEWKEAFHNSPASNRESETLILMRLKLWFKKCYVSINSLFNALIYNSSYIAISKTKSLSFLLTWQDIKCSSFNGTIRIICIFHLYGKMFVEPFI